ncbi:MAG: interleukin-like EMT inducer domain-containing protein [Maribacter sp.]|uniref:interleukin-like EMT inducer domain-containing protein n=1 Tax=Maribacter sp. TaxID=1897614 RepID=UPI00329997EF
MRIVAKCSVRMLSSGFLYVLISLGFAQMANADTHAKIIRYTTIESPTIILSSQSFNAKKRSGFTIAGQTEQPGRGLTIIHLNTSNTFEHRTFDTHANEEAAEKMVEILAQMLENNAKFAVLAHDSAAKSLLNQTKKLSQLGFLQLSTLKSRQAYIMHNFNGKIVESVDDVTATASLKIPDNIADKKVYFPKIRYEFEPNNNRYIAHAGGEVNGIKSTNTKEALDQNYKKGFRLFELDIIETSDGQLVAAHDWKMWSRFTDYKGELPPSHEEFMKHKIYGDYTTLDFKGINAWFAAHPDATLVTDKVNDPIAFADNFVDKDRLIMELFSQMAIEEAARNGIQPMISQTPLLKIKGDKINYLTVNNVKYVALSRRILANETKLMLQLKENGIKVYVYNVNFDPGKDEKYVQENEIGLVYGMYADKWVFDPAKKEMSK